MMDMMMAVIGMSTRVTRRTGWKTRKARRSRTQEKDDGNKKDEEDKVQGPGESCH